jgi:hypothetical protein
MELVEGQPIHHFVRDTSPSIEQRVELIVKVCRAVAYAHSIGIIQHHLKHKVFVFEVWRDICETWKLQVGLS